MDKPNTIPWPPLIYVSALALGLTLNRLLPLRWPDLPLSPVIGFGLCGLALALDVWSALTFRSHKTTIMPNKAASALIVTGPFAWSRNPIYLANTALLFGAGLIIQNGWVLLATPLAAYMTQKLAIEREEAHLAQRFGAAWLDYSKAVRRWL